MAWLKPLAAISELPVSIDSLVVQGTKITMEAPKLNGFTRDNRPYKVTAEAAAQDLTNPTILELSGIKGRMEMQSKATVDMTSVAGLYDTKLELLTLSQFIHIVSSDGYEGFLTEATIEVRQNQMVSEKPVEILMPTGKLNAKRMEITDSGALVRFDAGIKLALKPNPRATPGQAGRAGLREEEGRCCARASRERPTRQHVAGFLDQSRVAGPDHRDDPRGARQGEACDLHRQRPRACRARSR